jgi:CRP-like cAMP-binding protein
MGMADSHAFDPHTFLAKVGTGRTLVACPPQHPIFTQGEAADAVFYIQDGQVKSRRAARKR